MSKINIQEMVQLYSTFLFDEKFLSISNMEQNLSYIDKMLVLNAITLYSPYLKNKKMKELKKYLTNRKVEKFGVYEIRSHLLTMNNYYGIVLDVDEDTVILSPIRLSEELTGNPFDVVYQQKGLFEDMSFFIEIWNNVKLPKIALGQCIGKVSHTLNIKKVFASFAVRDSMAYSYEDRKELVLHHIFEHNNSELQMIEAMYPSIKSFSENRTMGVL